MKRRYIWDKEHKELVEVTNFVRPELKGPMIMRDIKSYKTVAWDKETNKPVYITSRSKHRAFLRRNGYEEVGNDKSMAPPSKEELIERRKQQQDTAPVIDKF